MKEKLFFTGDGLQQKSYPYGLVISPFSPWIAANLDQKVYCPERDPPYGLLEIKCPRNEHISDMKYLDVKS